MKSMPKLVSNLFTVKCCGEDHQIRTVDDKIVFINHDLENLRSEIFLYYMGIIDSTSNCAAILVDLMWWLDNYPKKQFSTGNMSPEEAVIYAMKQVTRILRTSENYYYSYMRGFMKSKSVGRDIFERELSFCADLNE